jgi:hypothetical protein
MKDIIAMIDMIDHNCVLKSSKQQTVRPKKM